MPRTKTGIALCVAFLMLCLIGVVINKSVSKSVKIWLNTPFDPAWAEWKANRKLTGRQSTKIHAAILLYTAHNHSRLPPMKNIKQAQLALLPYAGDPALLVNPVTHHFFQPNELLSHHKMFSIAHASQVVAFYDIHSPDPGYDKNQLLSYPDVDVLFLNGTWSTIPSYDWPKYRLASKIPANIKQEKL